MAAIIVPAVGLGLLWIISNHDDKKSEGYVNIGKKSDLPNSNLIPKNYKKNEFYPSKLNNLFKNPKVTNNVRKYNSQNDETKKYFTKKYQEEQNEKNYKNRGFKSLTGNNIDPGSLKHNNMVPWFGSKIRQPLQSHRVTENILDTFTGAGSQHQEKNVTAPLFKPVKDMHYINGAPNQTDLIKSRMNISHKISGVKPFQQVHVAPGLNRGFKSEGYGGFNAGMAAREEWMPKNIDELRTVTNPKLTFKGQFLGPKASVQNRGIQAKVEKQRPDTYWEHTPDRWFTTTGLEKKQTSRAQELLKTEHRTTTTREYYGAGHENNNTYAKRKFLPDKRQDLPTNPLGNAIRPNLWDSNKNDYGRDGFTVLPNSRTLTGETNTMGYVSRGFKALTTPVLDMLRPTRKENVIGNLRPLGNAKGPKQQKLYNRNQSLKSTIKEQFVDNNYIPMGVHAHDGGYATQNIKLKGQQRDSTQQSYIPNASASSQYTKPENYDIYNNTRLNNRDLLSVSRTNPGNMKLVNNNINVCVRKNPIICAEPMGPPKIHSVTPNTSAIGQQSYKITRGQFGNHSRTDPMLVSALQSNPYSKPLNSIA